MPQTPFKHAATVIGTLGLLAFALAGAYYAFSQHGPETDNPPSAADALPLQEQWNASAAAISAKMSREIGEFPKMAAICLANSTTPQTQPQTREFADVAPEVLRQIRVSLPKAQQYSFCRASFVTEYLALYAVESISLRPNGNVSIGVLYRDTLNGQYGDNEVYELQKSGGRWAVVKR